MLKKVQYITLASIALFSHLYVLTYLPSHVNNKFAKQVICGQGICNQRFVRESMLTKRLDIALGFIPVILKK
jgi:hypothetical protein